MWSEIVCLVFIYLVILVEEYGYDMMDEKG